jgi:GGDEF domain-containing protein
MTSINGRDYLAELSSSVACYLTTLTAVADCLGQSCREIGTPYRKRIQQLRARLSFQPTREALKESATTLQAELRDYTAVAAEYLDQHDRDLRCAILSLEDIIESMAHRSEVHGSRLQELAVRIETTNPADHAHSAQTAAELRRCIESMGHETASMLTRMREEIAAVEERLRGSQSTDPSTGLLNPGEITRQIEAYRANGLVFSLLRFELRDVVSEQVMQQAAAKLETQFRHRDRIARWSEREFLVLFEGPPQVAESRTPQVAQSLAGRYDLESGAYLEITVHSQVTHQELALA